MSFGHRRMRRLVLAGMMLAGGVVAQTRKQQDIDLQAAIRKETVDGDLKGAIKQYERITAKYKEDRSVVAKALLRMGECYEKLGDVQARKAYERLINSYPDQTDAAAAARARLAALGSVGQPARGKLSIRQVWSGSEADASGSPSADGRYLSYVHWETGDLALHDLVTEENRLLTNKGTWKQSPKFADLNLISPDGKLVAYSWDDGNTRIKGGELRLIAINGSAPPRLVYRDPDVAWLEPRCWSPDGKSVLAWLFRKDETNQIATISITDSSVRILKNLHKGVRYRGKPLFSPDGHYIAYDYRGEIYLLPTDGTREEVPVAPHPALDRLLAWAPDGKRILFASNRSGTMGAWVIRVADGKPQGSPELIKPNIGDSLSPIGMTANGSFFYGLTREISNVYVAELDMMSGSVISPPKLVTETVTPGAFTRGHGLGNTSSADWSPDGRELVYRSDRTVSILTLDSGTIHEIAPPVLGPLHWGSDGRSILAGGGTQAHPGLYTFDPQTGTAALLTLLEPGADIQDFAWAPDAKTVLYHAGNTVYAKNLSTDETKKICVSPEDSVIRSFAVSPDGRQVACVSARSLFVVPAGGGAPRELLRLKDAYDMFQFGGGVAWTPDGSQIVFARGDPNNVGQFNLWHILAAGGEPRKLDLAPGGYSELRMHPDGRRIAFTAGSVTTEVWVMDNFLK